MGRFKRRASLLATLMILTSFFVLASCEDIKGNKRYGVFIGAENEKLLKLKNYDVLILDAEYISKKTVDEIRANGNGRIYTYLSIGSIEAFRAGYGDIKKFALAPYENWKEEHWADVSDKGWLDYVRKRAKMLDKKGIDGFFLDNADVYYHYPKASVYSGLISIVQEIKSLGKEIILNGGDRFLNRYLLEVKTGKAASGMIDGVNQETVFTSIDFKRRNYGVQKSPEKKYFQKYIENCKEAGMDVYLLEYGAEGELLKQIIRYCKDKDFSFYNAGSLELR